jgi:general secretion pathway protein F
MVKTGSRAALAMLLTLPTNRAVWTETLAMLFDVRALDGHQQVQTLRLEALDIADASAQLTARQLTPLSLKSASSMGNLGWGSARKNKFDLLLFAQELHALVAAGLSVVEALEALIERSNADATRSVLQRLVAHLREGQRLSGALAQQSAVFPPLFIGVIQAAEGTSDLPRSLERYIAYETRLQILRHKITSAAIYPSILMGVGGAVAMFLLGYVVPRFATVYKGSGKPLPWASQMLLNWGEFASNYALGLLAAVIALIVIVVWAARRALNSGGWWRLLAWLPGARPRLQVLELSRLYLTMGMLLEGGIAVARAMQLSEAVVTGSKVPALTAARQSVGQGQSLSHALEQHQLSTPVAMRLLRVGEQTGQLGSMLSRTAAFYDNETTRWIERFTKAFEPILMAAIGIVIGLIVILLYMPIFDLAGNLQ